MFDPIRARKGEDAMAPDQMWEVLKEQLPERWDYSDFVAALTDRSKVTPEGTRYRGIPSLGMDETAEIFTKMDAEAQRRLELPEAVEPELPLSRAEMQAENVFVRSAAEMGFDPADGEWAVFRRDPSGRDALINQFENKTAAEAWARQQMGQYGPAERAATRDITDPMIEPEVVPDPRPEPHTLFQKFLGLGIDLPVDVV